MTPVVVTRVTRDGVLDGRVWRETLNLAIVPDFFTYILLVSIIVQLYIAFNELALNDILQIIGQ